MPKETSKKLSYKKCGRCRQDRQKCLPQDRVWPGRRCDRCLRYDYICSASKSKTQESTRLARQGLGSAQDVPSSRKGSLERVDRRRRSEAQCLQDLGDVRQLIVCCLDLNQGRGYKLNMDEEDSEDESDMDQDLEDEFGQFYHETLKKALQDVTKETEVWARQYEADGRYKDAAYLYDRIHSDWKKGSRIVPTLTALYEKMGDYPAAELAQEKLMRTILAKGQNGNNEEEIREVKVFTRLLSLFHTRLQMLGSASQTYAKLSIVYRAAVLDHEQLNATLFDQGLIVLDYQDKLNGSSVHIAVKKNALNLARFLLQKGANLNLKDTGGNTPLHIAVDNGTEEMVRLLLHWNADTEMKGHFGRTPIQIASSRGEKESILLLLIEKGADIEARDFRGRTPLANAICFDSLSSVRILIRNGADVNARTSTKNISETLLVGAVMRRKEWAANMLLEAGANPYLTDDLGGHALYYAIEYYHESMVKVLLDYGEIQHVVACPSITTTLLHLAVIGENLTIIDMILKSGADVNEQDSCGNTPLHDSLMHSHTNVANIVSLLLRSGAQVNVENSITETPLHLAVILCLPEAVRLLLDAGADPYVMDGQTALDLALPPGKEIMEMLDSHIAVNPRFTNTTEDALS